MAPLDSPREPTDEMVRLPGGVGRVGLARMEARWFVILERGVAGGSGGREGVRRPDLGSDVSEDF